MFANVLLLGNIADNVNEVIKTKINISRLFSAEKLNGNSAKQLLSLRLFNQKIL